MTEAAKLVDGERQAMYGDPRPNFERIAALWGAYLAEREAIPEVVSGLEDLVQAEQVADMMILLKLARDMGPGDCPDNMLDVQGYAEIKRRLKYPTKSAE